MTKSQSKIDLNRAIEAILFLAGKSLSLRKLSEFIGVDIRSAREAVNAFKTTWNARGGGTVVAVLEDEVQLLTHPNLHAVAESYVRDETQGELTRPQLEALTVIAYRSPITKAELEEIRGVHCGLIIRNLRLRGLIDERRDALRHEDVYTISMDFLRHLGLTDVHELPDYERLHTHPTIEQYLNVAASAQPADNQPAPSV